MMLQSDIWTYGLAPDVKLEVTPEQARLLSPAGSMPLSKAEQLTLAQKLSQGGVSEATLWDGLGADARDKCGAFLYRLDQMGFLCRHLMQDAQIIATCIPKRAPETGFPASLPTAHLSLSSNTVFQPHDGGIRAQVPGGWATVDLLDKRLAGLLFDLSKGVDATQDLPGFEPLVKDALLRLFAWCGLFETEARTGAPVHEVLFHSRTRNGFARRKIGKTGMDTTPANASVTLPQIALPLPDRADLIAHDPPYALVAKNRQSQRRQGTDPMTRAKLGELLFRCFYQEDGRRPYPSGGGLYPLTAYVVVHRCEGLASGLYAYDARHHGLTMIAENTPSLKALSAYAAAAADCASLPQTLLVLAADMKAMRAAYGDLAYSLVLKEVGAVFQCVQLAGAAMNLAVCPLGVGNAATFAAVSGLDIGDVPSVGEIMIGSSA